MFGKTLIALAVAFAVSSPVVAQDPAAESGIRLEVDTPVITAGASFNLLLSADFAAAADVSAALLGGLDLRTWIDGNDSVPLIENVDGTVRVAAGTSIRRVIPIDSAKLWQTELDGKSSLVIGWDGMPEARVTVRLVPDQSGIDIDQLDLSKTKVRLVTNFGEMIVSFMPDKAPGHVRNFVKLSKEGFYNGTRFHRIIRGFMIQGGDPFTKAGSDGQIGTGSPGYRIDGEFSDVKHVRGILSMARGPDPNSAGSQFFVMHGDAPSLDGEYSVFGQLASGLDTLDKIANVAVRPTPRGEPSDPVEEVNLYAAIVEPVFK